MEIIEIWADSDGICLPWDINIIGSPCFSRMSDVSIFDQLNMDTQYFDVFEI